MAWKVSKEYEGEWIIFTPSSPTVFKNIMTTPFSPLPNTNIAFCFEAWYQQVKHDTTCLYLFKLKLLKLFTLCIASTLEVVVNVKLKYADGSLFAEYRKMPSVKVDEINDVTFNDIVRDTSIGSYYSTLYNNMKCETLTIQCKMTFFDLKSSIEMKSSKCVDVMRNLKAMYEPSVLSDFVFKVGEKSFKAHKVILAAHSPVFKKMMTHDFLESKTNSVTITDASPEIFDLFLRCLYAGELEDKSWDSLKELYYLVDKYDVEFLKIECTSVAISSLSVDLVCELLKLAYNYSDQSLKTAAINFAVKHIKEIVTRQDWKDLVKTHSTIGYEVTVNFIPN